MIYATIRISETRGHWQVHELAVSDRTGALQHVSPTPHIYPSEEEAILFAKYQARLKISEVWPSISVDSIKWDIKTHHETLA
jgi:hypothetical protein